MTPEQRKRLAQVVREAATGCLYLRSGDAVYGSDDLVPAIAAALAHIDRLEGALRHAAADLSEVGQDYPGSSCQQWCEEAVARIAAALQPPAKEEPRC